ncbi:hypothetical protein HHK36_000071 [Tetracentron sinense]|uniref:Uncharacterized protein n=1 Tax=Tetracentron sinense TaxID=13715 RepID=A0A834ZRA6_TETSI|nr:hypothetical protein HHK36_000071 [Tetracentron sinense]
MAAKPLTSEAIANTEKKMDMTLDDIIKMSKNSTSQAKKQRVLNKNQKFLNGGTAQGNSSKLRRFMDSRSSLRQGILVQRRSSFQGNSFPVATEVSRKAAAAPVRNRTLNRDRVVNWNKPRYSAVSRLLLMTNLPCYQLIYGPVNLWSCWVIRWNSCIPIGFELQDAMGSVEVVKGSSASWRRSLGFSNSNALPVQVGDRKYDGKPAPNPVRVGAHLDQREAANGRIAQKQLQKHRQAMLVPKMRPQTLDSLFANMKEQRMIMLSQQKKQNSTARWGGGAQQRGRGRFGNLRN